MTNNRLREMRKKRLLTQQQLARKAKVSLRTIHAIEKGKNCRHETKRKLLRALKMTWEERDIVWPHQHQQ